MEKGFNDDELADIMNEIESLEQEFNEEVDMSAGENDELPETVEDIAEQEEPEEVEALAEQEEPEEVEALAEQEEPEEVEALAEQEEPEEEYFEPEQGLTQEDINMEDETYDFDENDDSFSSELDPYEDTTTESAFNEDGLKEVLEDLTEMPVDAVIPTASSENDYDNVHHLRPSAVVPARETRSMKEEKAKSTMSFKVSGDMTIDLSFEVAGQEIEISVNESQGLVIGMPGGAQFTLPISTNAVKKVS